MTRRLLWAFVALALIAVGCSSDDQPESEGATSTTVTGGRGDEGSDPPPELEDGIRIDILSSHADRVSGDDARVRVTPALGGDAAELKVTLDGADVTSQFSDVDGALEGVVVGFVEGTSTLRASASSDPGEEAVQRVRAWPRQGPMISGPHTPLLACSTEEQELGAPTDDDCSAPTIVTWRYVATDGQVRDLADPGAVPSDAATVEFTTADGEFSGPFLLRHEKGVVNRSVYDIVTVARAPGAGTGTGSGTGTDEASVWSGRLVHRFGDGCGATYGQGQSTVSAEDTKLLAQGFAVSTASFTTGSVQCNDVVSAETLMMVKERVVEQFGLPTATIGDGAGMGAAQIHLIIQNYPGLLDAAVAIEGFPDTLSVLSGASDCSLLQHWYATPQGAALSPSQRAAVNGHATDATCARWQADYGSLLDPTTGCDPAANPATLYDPGTNPTGVRCTVFDQAVNIYGRDPASGTAYRPLDNVGVQYGLDAVNSGAIAFEQFVALNRGIGGFDGDGRVQPGRHEAAPEVVATAYETGRISAGTGDQKSVPIIEVDVWNDPTGATADFLRPFSLRDRLVAGASPEVAPGLRIWNREPSGTDPAQAAATSDSARTEAFAAVLRWLDDLASRTGARLPALDDSRPVEAEDSCLPPGSDRPTRGVHVWDQAGPCRDRYPVSGDPRIAAGAPRTNDVLKCELKAVDPADYEFDLTNDQYQELLEVFPTGVCDWSFTGVGQTTPSMPDRTFEDVVTPEQLA